MNTQTYTCSMAYQKYKTIYIYTGRSRDSFIV